MNNLYKLSLILNNEILTSCLNIIKNNTTNIILDETIKSSMLFELIKNIINSSLFSEKFIENILNQRPNYLSLPVKNINIATSNIKLTKGLIYMFDNKIKKYYMRLPLDESQQGGKELKCLIKIIDDYLTSEDFLLNTFKDLYTSKQYKFIYNSLYKNAISSKNNINNMDHVNIALYSNNNCITTKFFLLQPNKKYYMLNINTLSEIQTYITPLTTIQIIIVFELFYTYPDKYYTNNISYGVKLSIKQLLIVDKGVSIDDVKKQFIIKK